MKTSNIATREWLPQNIEKLGREHCLARGEILFHKDDAAVGIYEIEHGQVRLSRLDQTGREIVLHVAGTGDLIAEASLFSKVYHCDAIAVTDARARLYPGKHFSPSSGTTPKWPRHSRRGSLTN